MNNKKSNGLAIFVIGVLIGWALACVAVGVIIGGANVEPARVMEVR